MMDDGASAEHSERRLTGHRRRSPQVWRRTHDTTAQARSASQRDHLLALFWIIGGDASSHDLQKHQQFE